MAKTLLQAIYKYYMKEVDRWMLNNKMMRMSKTTPPSRKDRILKTLNRDKYLIMLVLPVILYYIIFHYLPMYGIIIAFKDYSISKGILGSEWVGFKWFLEFFRSYFFGRLIKNTLTLSIYGIIFAFPAPIIFALLLNELRNGIFKRVVQTVSYLPHFISLIVVVGMMVNFLHPVDGIVNVFLKNLGRQPINFLADPNWFRPLYIGSGIWQEFGFGSIIYLAALASIDSEIYEAAKIDGANRWKQIRYVTIPGIMPTIMILLILRLGHIMSVGFEKIILMYNPSTYEVADVISTYVYRRGIINSQFSFAASVGLFNAVINLILLLTVNKISKRVSEISLW
jgi:putative aldouronate transport system permease protein